MEGRLKVDVMWAVRVAQRVDEDMMIVGSRMEGCFESLERSFKQMVKRVNQYQDEEIVYEPLEFEECGQNCCQLCLHHSSSDRKLGSHLGKPYHPECANLWLSRVNEKIPSLVPLEDSLY